MRFYFYLIAFLISSQHLALGQVHAGEDSIRLKLKSLPIPERIDYLHNLVIRNWLNYPGEAMKYANEAMRLSDSTNDRALLAKSIRLKGGVHYYMGNYDSTLFYSKESFEIAAELKDSILIDNALNNLGLVYYNLGSYPNALENLLRSLRLKEQTNEVYGRAQTINNVGLVYNKLKDYDKARSYFKEALTFSTEHNDPNLQLYSLNNIGGTYLAQGNIELAQQYFEKSRALQVNNKNWNAVMLSGLGQVELLKGNFNLAHDYFSQALKLREEIDDKKGVSEIYYFYAKDAYSRDNIDSALYLLNESQIIAKSIGSKDRMFENYELYVQLYSELGDYRKAFGFQNEFIHLRDELFNENMVRNLSDIQLKIQKEETSELLSDKEKELSNSRKITLFLTIIVLLAGIVLVMILLAFLNNRKVNKLLAAQNEEINNQKEEITRQKESLVQKNFDLGEAHNLIKQQNYQLEQYNEQLKQKVNERTQELEDSNERLKIANLELDNFIYKSAHDIKGPLATLMGICNVALIDVNDRQAQEYFKMMAETSKGLNETLARLKIVSEINTLKLTKEQIDFGKITEKAVEQVKEIEGTIKIPIHFDIQPQIKYSADPFLLDLIMFNMIHNAIKFQKDNSEEKIDVTISQDESNVIMHFVDKGIGIDEEDTDSIFHIYSKSAIKHKSLGLGLYVVKQCIEKLGGEIMLLDEEDLTHFKIELPNTLDA